MNSSSSVSIRRPRRASPKSRGWCAISRQRRARTPAAQRTRLLPRIPRRPHCSPEACAVSSRVVALPSVRPRDSRSTTSWSASLAAAWKQRTPRSTARWARCARGSWSARGRRRGAVRGILEAHLELIEDPELLGATRSRFAPARVRASPGVPASPAASRDCMPPATRVSSNVSRISPTSNDRCCANSPAGRDQRPRSRAAASWWRGSHARHSSSISTPARLAGIALGGGGPTSHVAILAATLGIPMLVSGGAGCCDIEDGAALILDADAGILHSRPAAAELAAARARLEQRRRAPGARARRCAQPLPPRRAANASKSSPTSPAPVADTRHAVAQGAEGCGLLRTEFLFLDRVTAPDEAEQLRSYQQVADLLAGRPLVIRTLDVGGDKPIAYLPHAARREPGARPARHPHQPVASRSAGRPVARAAGSQAAGSAASCCR